MKKYLILVLILISALVIWADKEDFLVGYIPTPEGSITYKVISTNADTSDVFDTREVMTFKFWAADTTGDDSVDIDFTFQTSPFESATSVYWTTQRTYILDADSSVEELKVTSAAIASDPFGRIIGTGSTNNSKSDSTRFRIVKSFYPRVQKTSR